MRAYLPIFAFLYSMLSFEKYKPFIREAIGLSLPIILGQLGIILMGVADTIMVGDLGSDVLASANQANNIFFMCSGLTFGVLFAISTLVSVKVGEGNPQGGFITYRAGLLISVILFVVQYIVLEIITLNFHWMGQDAAVNAMAPGFLHIINFSVLPMLVMVAARQYTDGLGFTSVAMYITIGGLVLNVFLNWLLIYGKLGLPALGLNGAAYATLISRVAMALAILWYIKFSKVMKGFIPATLPTRAEILAEMPKIWQLGLPVALQTFAEWACFAISGIMVGWLGATQLAAHAVALNVASVTYMIVSGIALAGSIMVGNAFGEGNKQKIRLAAHSIFLLILIFEFVTAVIFLVFNSQIADLYNVSADVREYVLPLLLIAALFQLADGVQAGAMNMMRGIKDVNFASMLSVLSYWIISLPFSYFLGIAMEGNVYGIWFGFTAGLFVAAALGMWRFYYRQKQLIFDYNYQ